MNAPPAPTSVLSSGGNTSNSALLTAEQVSARWQVPKAQVYRLAREDRLSCVRIGRYYRFALPALEAFERDGGWGVADG